MSICVLSVLGYNWAMNIIRLGGPPWFIEAGAYVAPVNRQLPAKQIFIVYPFKQYL